MLKRQFSNSSFPVSIAAAIGFVTLKFYGFFFTLLEAIVSTSLIKKESVGYNYIN